MADTENKKVAQEQPKNKYQQRIENGANEARNAYAELRELYDDPTDEQILAAVGNNLRAYQTQTGNKAGNWGLAFGSNALAGTLNKDTKKSLEDWYQKTKTPTKLSERRAEIIDTIGTGDTAKNITRGMQMDVRNWGNTITDTNAITPEQVRKLNAILGSNIVVPTEKVKSVGADGKEVENDVEQTMTRDEIIDILDDDYMDALYTLGFVDEDGNYRTPHAETFEEKLARQERERERIEMLTQQKALQRQKARAGLADLAAGIGDMIKASGGAIVNPRDYRAMYDSLTEQQKTNYNNYLARMQALKEQEKAKQKEAADRAYQERLLAEQRAYQEGMRQKQWKHDEDVLEQKFQNKLKEIQARGKEKRKEIDARYKNQQDKFNNSGSIVFDGVDYTFDKAHNNNAISSLLSIVRNYFTEDNGYLSMLEGIENSSMSEYSKAYDTANVVVSALKEFEYQFSEDDRDNIVRVLTEYSNSRKTVKSPVGGVTPVKPANAEQMYRNKETGEEVPKSEWDTYRPSKKELYEPVTA